MFFFQTGHEASQNHGLRERSAFHTEGRQRHSWHRRHNESFASPHRGSEKSDRRGQKRTRKIEEKAAEELKMRIDSCFRVTKIIDFRSFRISRTVTLYETNC